MEQTELSFAPPPADHRLGTHRARLHHLLSTYSERGHKLGVLSGPKYLGRSLATLKKYCRDFQIKFPDYIPRSMRPKKEKKARKSAKSAV